jgi:hypothetical protein
VISSSFLCIEKRLTDLVRNLNSNLRIYGAKMEVIVLGREENTL